MSMGGGKKPVSQQPKKALGIDFQGAQYGPPIPVVYGRNKVAGNCIWYGDFQAIAQQQKQSSGKGGGGSSSTTSYTYKASYQLALCEGPISSVPTVYNGTSTTTLSALGAVLSIGTSGQAAWSHLSGAAALGYSNTAVVSFANRDLGSQASLPNDNFEVAGLKQYGGGIVDAEFSAIFTDICNDTIHGLSGVVPLGDLTQWHNYCVAAGLFVSPVYDQQDTAQSALEDLLKYGNAAAWFSEGVLKVGCYGDQTITGNGVTYTPDLTAVADLGPDDFITNGPSPPVTISRTSPADALNIIRVEYKDRANTYHDSVVLASIDEDVITNGGRSDDSESVDMATTGAVASQIAWNLLQRKFYVRNQYEFKLSWRYCYLEPFDILTLTDSNTGLNRTPVRVLSVEEDEHGLLDIVAEECPEGIGHAATVATQGNSGATVDPDADPGPVAGPYLFRGPGFLVGNNKPEIWCAVTGDGNPLWAGCDVYLSHDGTSYTYVCSYARQARYGYITNSMAVQSDPDTVSAPNVVLNGFQTQLLGGSQADADQFITLAMIDGEVMAYETATLAAGPSYNLSYLRRGGYGTAIAAHSANAPFVRLDDGILRIPVDPSQIGSTIYLKFLSVNCFGRTPRTLAGETAYQYVIGTSIELPDVPVVPDNFTVTPVADGVSITWLNDNPAAVGCTSIEYATASGGPWTVLAQCGPTHTSFHHSFTSGATYYYRARSRGPLVQSGWSAYTATLSSTGVNVSGTGGVIATVTTNTTNIATATTLANSVNVQNPGFDAGDTGWSKDTGWTIKTDGAGPGVGVGYAQWNPTGGNGAIKNNSRCLVIQGQTYKVQALIRASGANGSCYAAIAWWDSSNAFISITPGNVVTGSTTTGSYAVGRPPANAMYGSAWIEADSCTTGTYQVDNVVSTLQASNLSEVPDGGGRFAVAQVDGNGLAVIDFSQTVHVNKTLDYVPDGGVRIGSTQYSDSEIVDNANFEASASLPIPGWSGFAATLGYVTGGQAHAGNRSMSITAGGSAASASQLRKIKCTPNDVYLVQAWIASSTTHAWKLGLNFFSAATGQISTGVAANVPSGGGWAFYAGLVQVPANADYFQVWIGSTATASGDQIWVDDVALGKVRAQNGIMPITWAGVRSVLSSSPITYSINTASPATVTFNVAAFTNYGGGLNVAYNASSGSVTQARSTTVTYYLYFRDPISAGGSLTLHITTNVSDLAQYPDIVNIGSASVAVAASGGGSGSGSGGGGYCVCADMFVDEDTLASEADIGHLFDCCDWPNSRERTFKRRLHSVEYHDTECVRITTDGGAVLECGVTTPFDLLREEGGVKRAPAMLGERVITDRGIETVVRVQPIGVRPVCFFHFGGISYAAGADPAHRIYSHNTGGITGKP